MSNDEFNEENVFGVVGLADNGDHYSSMAGLYDYFWALKPDTREKMILGWIEALENFLDPIFDEHVLDLEGELYVVKSLERVEEKEADQITSAKILPFRKREEND